jgi:hypothetical protein
MNKITDVTRQAMADEMSINKLWYHGRLEEPDFWARIFNLQNMPSRDSRYSNAYEDINKHMVMNTDWHENWYLNDPRFNLLFCDDDIYRKFLAQTIHPSVRTNENEIAGLIEIYDKHLAGDEFNVVRTGDISGKPIFEIQPIGAGAHLASTNKAHIKKYLNTKYVDAKIMTMHDALNKDSELAIGTAKELLETTCKSILKQKNVEIDKDWTLPVLVKNTYKLFDFKPKDADRPENAEKAILMILSGLNSIVQGIAELRNSYGTGHGKDADFKGLEAKYAKLLVGVVSELVIFLLATNGETAELVEEPLEF